jgi:hypothetical protein
MALGDQVFPQFPEIPDGAIVNHCQLVADVRMRVVADARCFRTAVPRHIDSLRHRIFPCVRPKP